VEQNVPPSPVVPSNVIPTNAVPVPTDVDGVPPPGVVLGRQIFPGGSNPKLRNQGNTDGKTHHSLELVAGDRLHGDCAGVERIECVRTVVSTEYQTLSVRLVHELLKGKPPVFLHHRARANYVLFESPKSQQCPAQARSITREAGGVGCLRR